MDVLRCFGTVVPMRSRCFWPEVKILFFKKVRDVFRPLAKKTDAIWSKYWETVFGKLWNYRPCHLVGPLSWEISKKMRYGHVRAFRNRVRSSPLDMF